MRAMTDKWRERLVAKIREDGRTPRAISLAAGLGPNFLTQMIARGTSPTTDALVKLCDALRVSITYILTGAEMTPDDEEMLRLAAQMSDEEKGHFLGMLRARNPERD